MSEQGGARPDDEPSFKPKKRGLVVVLLLVAALAAGGVVVATRLRSAPEPLRVLVAVDANGLWWEGSVTSARLLDNVVPHLKKLGFDAVNGGDAAVVEKLKGAADVNEAARRLGASFIVTGPVKLEVTDLGKPVGIVEVRARGTIHLSHVSGGAVALGEVRTWAGMPTEEQATRFASEALGKQTFDIVLPGLMAHPAIAEIERGSDRLAAGKLSAAKVYLEKRASQLGFAKTSYDELRQKLERGDQSSMRITLHGPMNRQDGLGAVGASGFFVKSSAIRPFYTPVEGQLRYFVELEKLYWQAASAKPRVVFEGYNVLGYPSASPDGTVAAYVEDLYGGSTVLAVIEGTSAPVRVFSHPKLRLSEPKVSPGGAFAAVWARTCRGCPAMVVVVDLKAKKSVHESDPKLGTIGGFVWLGPRRLGVLLRSAPPASPAPDAPKPVPSKVEAAADADGAEQLPSQSFDALDFASVPPARVVLGAVSGAARLALPAASGDGSRVVFSRAANDGMHLALYDAATSRLEPLPVEHTADPALAPAGDKIAFVRGGDLELYDVAGQKAQPLTKTGSDFELRYPLFSLDGRTIYFEVRAKDPVFPRERSVSTIASVPVP